MFNEIVKEIQLNDGRTIELRTGNLPNKLTVQ